MLTNLFNLKRFLAIVKKEFIQLKRDPIAIRIPIVMPIMMMLLFGYAVNTEVDKITTAVFDQSRTQESREYVEKFTVSNYFSVKYYVTSNEELSNLIDSGKVKAGIIIPTNYASDIRKNKSPQTQLIIDGTDPTTARTAF